MTTLSNGPGTEPVLQLLPASQLDEEPTQVKVGADAGQLMTAPPVVVTNAPGVAGNALVRLSVSTLASASVSLATR